MISMLACLHAGDRARQGVAGIEFALIAPLLALIFAFTIDLALAVRAYLTAQNAAAAGAQYVLGNGWDTAAVANAVVVGTDATNVAASPAPSISYGCPSGSAIVAATSTTICADGLSARLFATISASVPRQALFGVVLGLPTTVQAHVTVEVP